MSHRAGRLAAAAVLAVGSAACGGGGGAPSAPSSPAPEDAGQVVQGSAVVVRFQPPDAPWGPIVLAEVVAGRENATAFFGAPIAGEVPVLLFPDRASLTAHWRRIWSNPAYESECWLIASGDSTGIVMLSPGAWTRDSCGHDGADDAHRRGVAFHEVVHVHHARRNASWALLGPIWWFVEGIAEHASGRHDAAQRAHVREVLASGDGPRRLSEVLPAGYDFAGSLVAWIDRRHGRARLTDLLDVTTEAALLQRLGSTEEQVLAAWRTDVPAGR
jgi:hypothetical protein